MGVVMLDIEIESLVGDALARGLSTEATLSLIKRRVTGASTDQLLKGTVAALREQLASLAQLETEIDYLVSEIARLGERETDLEGANEALEHERHKLQHELEELRDRLASTFVSASSGGQDHATRQ
jgi:peptidoglycan hydrolase CwlO-like protein